MKDMNSVKAMLFASVAFACFAALAETVYTITTTAANTFDSPLGIDGATVSVFDGTSTIEKPFSEVKGAFASGAVFRKRGEGYLQGSDSMISFSGEIRIEEGGYMVITNGCLGLTAKSSSPNVVISNGASLVISATSATCKTKTLRMYNPITFEGDGYEGRGAISIATENCSMQDQGFGGNWYLTGDAKLGFYTSDRADCTALDYFYLSNHVFTVKQMDAAGTFVLPRHIYSGGTSAKMIFDGPNVSPLIQDTAWWGTGYAENEFVLTNGAHLGYYIMEPQPSWTLVAEEGAWMTLAGKDTYPSDLAASNVSYNVWNGPLRLNGSMFNIICNGYAKQGAKFKGHVHGKGGICGIDSWLQLYCASNSFEGGVTVSPTSKWGLESGLALWANGALPAGNACGAVITNASVYLGAAEEYTLPKFDYTVDSGTNRLHGVASGGTLASLKKSGAGVLDLASPLAVTGVTEVAGGTVVLQKALKGRVYSAVPGLWCGTSPDSSGAGATDSIVYSNSVDSRFAMLSQKTYPPWTQSCPTVWGGYIWNRSPTNETWTFAVSVRAMGRVYIDGAVLVVNDNYADVTIANKVMTPGAHKFRFAVNPRTYSSPGSASPFASWTNSYGIAIDRHGRYTKDYLDYEFPMNAAITNGCRYAVAGGDGWLFTRDSRDTNDFTEAELQSLLRPTKVSHLVMKPSSTLDLAGEAADAPLPITNCTGAGSFANGSVILAGKWTLVAAEKDSWPLIVSGGNLSFGSAASVDCDISNLKVKSSGYVIAQVSGAINGLPAVSQRLAEDGWFVKLDDNDFRKLLLCSGMRGLLIIFK